MMSTHSALGPDTESDRNLGLALVKLGHWKAPFLYRSCGGFDLKWLLQVQ